MFDPEVAAALGEVEFSLDEIFAESAAKHEAKLQLERDRSARRRATPQQKFDRKSYMVKWNADNAGHIKQYHKNRYSKNRDKMLEDSREWYKENKERVFDAWLRRKYDITLWDYNNMLYAQNCVCAGCKKPRTGRRLAVDHCHEPFKVRGLLCTNCNRAVGLIHDDYATATNIAGYLEASHAV